MDLYENHPLIQELKKRTVIKTKADLDKFNEDLLETGTKISGLKDCVIDIQRSDKLIKQIYKECLEDFDYLTGEFNKTLQVVAEAINRNKKLKEEGKPIRKYYVFKTSEDKVGLIDVQMRQVDGYAGYLISAAMIVGGVALIIYSGPVGAHIGLNFITSGFDMAYQNY